MNDVQNFVLRDSLTGLPTRIHFNSRLADEWHRHARPRQSLALLLIDLDRFHLHSRAVGPRSADATLAAVAHLLRQTLYRETDFLARDHGHGFIAILPDTDAAAAIAVAERLRGAVERLGAACLQPPLGPLTVSVGVGSAVPSPGASADELLRAAEAALQRAKLEGRNRVAAEADAMQSH